MIYEWHSFFFHDTCFVCFNLSEFYLIWFDRCMFYITTMVRDTILYIWLCSSKSASLGCIGILGLVIYQLVQSYAWQSFMVDLIFSKLTPTWDQWRDTGTNRLEKKSFEEKCFSSGGLRVSKSIYGQKWTSVEKHKYQYRL